VLKDSGARREFTTGAVRDIAEGKDEYDGNTRQRA
jgi:hypothetical protein